MKEESSILHYRMTDLLQHIVKAKNPYRRVVVTLKR